jgi:hypothetical protein
MQLWPSKKNDDESLVHLNAFGDNWRSRCEKIDDDGCDLDLEGAPIRILRLLCDYNEIRAKKNACSCCEKLLLIYKEHVARLQRHRCEKLIWRGAISTLHEQLAGQECHLPDQGLGNQEKT